jgi:hypothetical protein
MCRYKGALFRWFDRTRVINGHEGRPACVVHDPHFTPPYRLANHTCYTARCKTDHITCRTSRCNTDHIIDHIMGDVPT